MKGKQFIKNFFNMGPVFSYFFRKKNTGTPTSFNLKAMNIINKLSAILFLLAVVYILIKRFFIG